MDNFISPELGGLCLILWAFLGVGFIWYVHKIKQFNMEPNLRQELEEIGEGLEAHLTENSQASTNDADPYETNPKALDQPTR